MKVKASGIKLAGALACSFALSGGAFADTATLQKLNADWDSAFNRGDAKALAALYHEKATLSPGNGKTLTGRAEIEKLFKSFIDGGVNNHKIDIVESGMKGDMAYQVSRWSANGAEKDGKKPSFGGVLVNVHQRASDGKWQSVSHVWNAAN